MIYYKGDKKYPSVVGIGARFALDQMIFVLQIIFLLFDGIVIHCLGMSYYVNFLGGFGSNEFHIK